MVTPPAVVSVLGHPLTATKNDRLGSFHRGESGLTMRKKSNRNKMCRNIAGDSLRLTDVLDTGLNWKIDAWVLRKPKKP